MYFSLEDLYILSIDYKQTFESIKRHKREKQGIPQKNS